KSLRSFLVSSDSSARFLFRQIQTFSLRQAIVLRIYFFIWHKKRDLAVSMRLIASIFCLATFYSSGT
ncbi:hypothetical protein, partial [Staphylococcus argenteus]|uniref:hypothetical protein n=1 Tax=Staphylococcus argenteus TaxID=985002 RepID=UPI001FB8C60F